MARVHLISRNPLHLSAIDIPVYESGYWILYELDAQKLVNGQLYLHQKKTEPSYFGGTVTGYRVAGPTEPYPGKIVFTVTAEENFKNIPWEGDTHPMAWMGGILD